MRALRTPPAVSSSATTAGATSAPRRALSGGARAGWASQRVALAGEHHDPAPGGGGKVSQGVAQAGVGLERAGHIGLLAVEVERPPASTTAPGPLQ